MEIRLEVLEDPLSQYINELILIQKELLPDYHWNPANMVNNRFNEKGRLNSEIIMGFCDNELAGFIQIYYIYYYNKVFINLDFVAVLPQYRKSGLGLMLLTSLKNKMEKPVGDHRCIGIIGLAEIENSTDQFSFKRLFLYSRLGAQIRRDIVYKTPDYPDAYVIFYPATESFSSITTLSLAWQLWRNSQYSFKVFKNYISSIDSTYVRSELIKYN
ncbi:MAG: GNAT family N-acetyltransferase [Eubacteriales bacterium]|mgnify:CR=1 FL=1|nr:GNAT family N-acetyltransferase [Eubacteriales bacterium]